MPRLSLMDRERYDRMASRSEALAMRGQLPAAFLRLVKKGDVPAAANALRAHLAKGGPLPGHVRGLLRTADKSGAYEDVRRAVEAARDAFGNLDEGSGEAREDCGPL